MNQEKIGNFIKEKRKEKNLTQEELAAKLGVSNRTISKWENGNGMPDYSIILDLCNKLDISINELLSGEEIKEENYQSMLEANMLKTIDYNNKKRNKKNLKTSLITIAILVVLISIGYRSLLINGYTTFKNNIGYSTMDLQKMVANSTNNKVEVTKNNKANTEVRESLKMYMPDNFRLITDIREHSGLNSNCDLYTNDNTYIRICGAGNTLWDNYQVFSMYLDKFNTNDLFTKYGFKSIYNVFEYYLEHSNDTYNFFSKLDDIRLMYAMKIIFSGSPTTTVDYYLYNYDNVEGLTEVTKVDDNRSIYNTTITLLTPKEYRSYNIIITAGTNDLSVNEVKDILASFETTIK